MIVFSIIIAIAPGENLRVAAAGEKLRDRIAHNTARIEGTQELTDAAEDEAPDEEQAAEDGGGLTDLLGGGELKNSKLWNVLKIVLLMIIVMFIPSAIHDRLEKKKKKNREGIDSTDNAIAIRSMMTYSLRWMNLIGPRLERNLPYEDYTEQISKIMPEEYIAEYNEMLDLWTEAAYSRHQFTQQQRTRMEEFMKQTIRLAKEKGGIRTQIRARFIEAL